MAKKELADLIREEVGKSADGEGNGAIGTPATSPSENSGNNGTTVTQAANQQATSAPKRRRSPTKADLEATVAKLTLQLDKAKATEAQHQKQMAQAQQDFTQQIDTLNAELAEAKSTILQLVDNNANAKTLQAQVTALQAELIQEKEKVTSLQQNLQQVDTLKTELDQAQKQIAQLSKAPSAPARPTFSRPAAKPLRPASRTA
ncbi:MAG: hypothetical protein F6K30_22480, partial [Cyanothece sp. SIO2G6]|nr:hypothetical protein [Cyanothece sp. SIO2G6]